MPKQDANPQRKQSAWADHPDYRIDIEASEKPMRIIYNGETIADSQHALRLQEQNYAPVYYFPRQDVRMDLLHPTAKTTFCPFKGEASYWALIIGAQHIEVAAGSYDDPFDEVNEIEEYIAFYPEAGDLTS